MTRDETIALFLQGREAWNAWAEAMLAERKALEEAGEWYAETHFFGWLEGQNDKTEDWIARADVDFSRCRVVKAGADASSLRGADAPKQSSDQHGDDLDRHGADAPRDDDESDGLTTIEVTERFDCSGFIFPANANFRSAQFRDTADFEGAQFHARADFNSARFRDTARFDHAQFHAGAIFHDANFQAFASFLRSQFTGIEGSLEYVVSFADARFQYAVSFKHARFQTATSFRRTKFYDRVTSFQEAQFAGRVSFISAIFRKGAIFSSIYSRVGFNMSGAQFGRVPDFTQSTLHRDPRLDNVTVKRGSILGPVPGLSADKGWLRYFPFLWFILRRIDRDAPAKFRELKRFAIQGEDHRSELQFHAQEIRTARWVNDFPLRHPRFWFGVGYELLSNFGRSIIRPAIAWGALVTVFAAIYLGISAEMNGRAPDYYALAPQGVTQPCLSVAPVADERVRAAQAQIAATTSASAEAWSLALKNGFVFIDWDRTEAARRTYGCLFGLTSDGGNTYPVVPRAVSVAGLIQNVLSAVLIFLLLLGIRNLLKLK